MKLKLSNRYWKSLLLVGAVVVVLGLVAVRQRSARNAAQSSQTDSFYPVRDESGLRLKQVGFQAVSSEPEHPTPAARPAPTRKLVRNGRVTLRVSDYDPFFAALQQQVAALQGYVAQLEVQRSSGVVTGAQIALRVPPAQLDALVNWLRRQGMFVSEQITDEDVSEQYYDVRARLDNARRFESRLLEMVRTQTGRLQDLMLVEEKLNEVRAQIEQMEAKIRYFDNLVSMATLTLTVQVPRHGVLAAPPAFLERCARIWRQSVRSLTTLTQELALAGVAIAPWVLPVLAVLSLGWYGLKALVLGWTKLRGAKTA
ncbi:MAG: DUF4349 domain-containing protein [Acidobacteriota bacterium]